MMPERLAELILKAHAKGIPPARIAARLLTSEQTVARIIADAEKFQSAQDRAAVIRPDQPPIHDVKPPCSTRAGGGAHPSGRFSEARPKASRRLRPVSTLPMPARGEPTGGGSPGGGVGVADLSHLGGKEPRGCRYIAADTIPGTPWRYCQAEQKPGSPYCEEHHKLCRRSPKGKNADDGQPD
jgi:hypothetical protein